MILAATWGTGTIYQLDPADGSTINSWAVSASNLRQLEILENKIYWADGAEVGWVDTESADTFTVSMGGADNLAVFPDGTIVAAVNNRNVSIYDPVADTVTTINNAAFGIDGASTVVLGDHFFAYFGQGEFAKLTKAGSLVASGSVGESASGGVAATDGTRLYFGGTSQIHIYDSDLNFVTNWSFGDAQAIEFYSNGEALINDAAADLLRIVDANGTSTQSVSMGNPAGNQRYRADTDNQFAYAALESNVIHRLDAGLNSVWTRSVAPQNINSIAASGVTGPITNQELFNANYADASAADAKATALVQPTDVQRSIDTDVYNLKDGPNLHVVEAIFGIGELENLEPYNPTTGRGRVYFVRDNQPGLRDGKNVLLKGYQIRDDDPGVPVTCIFWSPD